MAAYDTSKPLIIDPVLSYSTYFGGSMSDVGWDIAVDAAGNAYVTGRTFSARGFPAKNAFLPAGQGSFDAFVTKIDPSKVGPDSLVYSTFLGGGDSDEGYGIAVDAAGSAYVAGRTFSARGFPTTMNNAFQSQGQGSFDVFISKLTNVLPVPNDFCTQATAITTLPFTQMLDARGATTSPDDPLQSCSSAGAARNSNSVWYRFTPSQNGTVTVSTVGSNYDTILTAYTGSCGSLREVICNDDFGSGVESQITFDVTAGTTYLIEVTDFDDRPGAGMLVFTLRFTPR